MDAVEGNANKWFKNEPDEPENESFIRMAQSCLSFIQKRIRCNTSTCVSNPLESLYIVDVLFSCHYNMYKYIPVLAHKVWTILLYMTKSLCLCMFNQRPCSL